MLVVAGGAVVAVAAGTIGVVDDEDTETFLGLPPLIYPWWKGVWEGFFNSFCYVLVCHNCHTSFAYTPSP